VNLGAFQDRRSDLLRATIKHNWFIIIVCMALGATAGYFLAQARPAQYSSSTTVLVNAIVGNPYTPDSNSDTLEMLQTEAVAVTSQASLEEVIDNLDLNLEPGMLRNRTTVTIPPNTQAMKIGYTDSDKADPQPIVDEIARVYLQNRQDEAKQSIAGRDDDINTELTQTRELLRQTEEGSPQASNLQAQIIALTSEKTTNLAQVTAPGRVLTPGFEPVGSQTKHTIIYMVALAILGAIGGLSLGLVRERRRDLIRSVDDLSDYDFDAPVTAIHGKEVDEDVLRHLRMRLAPQIRDHGIISLVGMRSGHALQTGVLLGESLASGGTSVVLIDATGTEAGHKDPLDMGDQEGLAEALLGVSAKVPTAYQVEKNFNYLPAGQNAMQASERLVTDRARTVIHGVAERFDLTMIATMPLEQIEGEAVSRLTAGVLLLVETGRSSHYDLGAALTTINGQGRRLLGVFVLPRGT
jgi:capsular polysaccharide biosynthesis protein